MNVQYSATELRNKLQLLKSLQTELQKQLNTALSEPKPNTESVNALLCSAHKIVNLIKDAEDFGLETIYTQ